jgi:hypothetical protein
MHWVPFDSTVTSFFRSFALGAIIPSNMSHKAIRCEGPDQDRRLPKAISCDHPLVLDNYRAAYESPSAGLLVCCEFRQQVPVMPPALVFT